MKNGKLHSLIGIKRQGDKGMFVLDDDKPFFVLPVCYHPTTVLVVDDEGQFLNTLKTGVSDHLSLLCFDNPDDALKYIKGSRDLQVPFAARLHFSGKNDTQECGFTRMLDNAVQDIIHPCPKGIHIESSKTKGQSIEDKSLKIHETARGNPPEK